MRSICCGWFCRTLPLLTSFAILLVARPAATFEVFDFDQQYLVQKGFILKDHSIITDADGLQHIFYIKADLSVPEFQRAKTLGHATSTDLTHWTFHPDVVPVVANTWEENFVWAPHVIEANGQYYMFYTGVNRNFAQAIGVATSPDLFNWTKSPANPVYKPSTTWANWNTASWSNCRDPFVFKEGGTWYMLTTTHTIAFKGSISFASSDDLINWVDQGPLLVHPGPNAWHVLESPNMHFVNKEYNLFFTEEGVGGTSYLSSPTTAGPWIFNNRTMTFDLGHATELFRAGGQWRLSRHWAETVADAPFYVIKIDDLDWKDPGVPLLAPTNPLSEWTIVSGSAFDVQPTFWDNPLERDGGTPSNFVGNSWIGTFEAFSGHLQVGLPGDFAGEFPTGVIRSPMFQLTGNRISFRIASDPDINNLYIALITDDGIERLRSTGSGNNLETMSHRVWDVTAWLGESVQIEIADLSTTGHINIDEIVEFFDTALPTDVGDGGGVSDDTAPEKTQLYGNHPNPFNPSTSIEFDVTIEGNVDVEIFDVRGKLVRTLNVGQATAGRHAIVWDGRDAQRRMSASGVYRYRLKLGDTWTESRSMVLVR